MASEAGSLLYTVLKIRKGEFSRTGLHFLYLLNVVGAFIIGRTVASALFLAEYDASQLPWMYVASAVAVAGSSWLYSRSAGKVRLDRLVAISTVLLAVAILLARAALWMKLPAVYPVLYVLVEVMGSVMIIQFWSFTNTLHTTREAKRLFGVIGAGGVLANIIVGFGTAGLLRVVATEDLLLLMSVNMLACVALVSHLGRRGQQQLVQAMALGPQAGKWARMKVSQEATRVFASKHLKIIAGIVALTFIVTTLVDYQFKIIAAEAFAKEDLATFFSLLYGFTGIIALFIQLFVTGRLLERFGIMVALALLPGSIAISVVGLFLWPLALTAAVAKGADAVFRYTVNDATTQLLYLPVPAHSRLKAKAFIDGILKPVAYGATGLALALGLMVFPALNENVHYLAIPCFILALSWLGLVFGIRDEYVKSLLDTLRRRRLNLHDTRVRISDDSTIKVLVRSLTEGNNDEILNALTLLPYVEEHDWDPHVVHLLQHDSEQIRVLAVKQLSVRGSLQYGNEVFRAFEDPSELVRAAAIRAYCAIGGEKAIRAVRGFLDDESPPIRAAAMVGLIKYGGLDGVLAAAEALKTILDHEDPRLREHGAHVLGAIAVKNFYQPVLKLLGDPDSKVQLAAIASAGRMQSPELIPPLVYKLADKSKAPAAANALAAYGEKIEPTLRKVIGNSLEVPTVRRNIPRILTRLGSKSAAEILTGHLQSTDEDLRQRVCQALNRIHHRRPGLEIEMGLIVEAVEAEARAGFKCLRTLDDLDLDSLPLERGGLLGSALREKLERILERIFLLLGVIYPSKTMEVVFISLHADSAVARANALEVLDNTLSARLKRLILPLVDDTPMADKLGVAQEVFGLCRSGAEDALTTLLDDPNAWVVACAVRHVSDRASSRDPAIARLVMHHLRSLSPVVRETTAWVVHTHLPIAEAVTVLEPYLQDEALIVRRVAEALVRSAAPLTGSRTAPESSGGAG